MKRGRDRLILDPPWHVDCRLVAELPDDSVVGVRFITYAVSCAIALAVVLFTGWYVYADLNLRHQIDEGNHQLEDVYWDVAEIRRLQRFYEIEAKKVENAYAEIKTPILISGFISDLGHTIPDRMLVDSIDYGEGKTTVRGRLRESPEHASQTIGTYVDMLRVNPTIAAHFSTITITGLEPSAQDDQMMGFEITFHLKPRSP